MRRNRWVVLGVGTAAQATQAAVFAGLAVLAPDLRDRYELSLTQVGVLLGVASLGATLTLLVWGIAADAVGERMTGSLGLLGSALGIGAAAVAPDFVSFVLLLAVAGAFGASINTATGRAVTSWFAHDQRGFALGIRQTSVPIGGFAAALGIPPIAELWGLRAAIVALAGVTLLAAVAALAWLVEGPVHAEARNEPETARHPIRDRRIWRLSVGSGALVCAQVAITGFIVIFLESRRGFSATEAGVVLAAINALGVVGRLAAGRRSDRRGGRRLELLRQIAGAAAVVLGAVVLLAGAATWILLPALVVGGGLTMAWNGLAVAATLEAAGPRRRGAALGLQQTFLGAAIVVTPLVFAPLVDATSWRAGFAVVAAAPVAALLVLRPLRG